MSAARMVNRCERGVEAMVHCHFVLRSVHSLGHLQFTHITLSTPSLSGIHLLCGQTPAVRAQKEENHFSWAVFEDVWPKGPQSRFAQGGLTRKTLKHSCTSPKLRKHNNWILLHHKLQCLQAAFAKGCACTVER